MKYTGGYCAAHSEDRAVRGPTGNLHCIGPVRLHHRVQPCLFIHSTIDYAYAKLRNTTHVHNDVSLYADAAAAEVLIRFCPCQKANLVSHHSLQERNLCAYTYLERRRVGANDLASLLAIAESHEGRHLSDQTCNKPRDSLEETAAGCWPWRLELTARTPTSCAMSDASSTSTL